MALSAHLRCGGASSRRPSLLQQSATFVDAKVKWVRDGFLDRAVEKEKHLRPLHSLKDLLLRRHGVAAAALPLSAVAERRDELGLPFRAIRFIRKYPSAFVEERQSPYTAAGQPIPCVRATEGLRLLHKEEMEIYPSCRAETADRLRRLLLLTRRRRLPLAVIDQLGWDLGLPRDFVRSLLPDYPDYFELLPSAFPAAGPSLDLAVVSYNEALPFSAMERAAAAKNGGECRKGTHLAFPHSLPRGFDLEKKVRMWTEELQRTWYISPYEDATHLDPTTAVAEKWAIGVLHELLHLMASKRTELGNIINLGEFAGLRQGIRKMVLHYPGIFYISNKTSTQTVVLREAFRKDLLVEKHPVMGMRYRYIKLMNTDVWQVGRYGYGKGWTRGRDLQRVTGDGGDSSGEDNEDKVDEDERGYQAGESAITEMWSSTSG